MPGDFPEGSSSRPLVERVHLLSALQAGPVGVVIAAGGYGKSVLADQFARADRRAIRRPGRRTTPGRSGDAVDRDDDI